MKALVDHFSVLQLSLLLIASASDLHAEKPHDWSPISIPIGAALEVPGCQRSPYLSNLPQIPNRASLTINTLFDQSSSTFRGKQRQIITVRQIARTDAEWVKQHVLQAASEQIPKESCDSIGLGAFSYSTPGNGTLVADVDVHYQVRACMTGFCCQWLQCHRCTWATDVPGESATIGIHTVITPVMQPSGDKQVLSIQAVSTAAVKDGPSQLVKNIVGALTLGIGSKYMQDTFDHLFGNFQASLAVPRDYPISYLDLPKPTVEGTEIPFQSKPPFFEQTGAGLAFGAEQSAELDPGRAAKVRTEVIEAQKFFDSCLHPREQYVVQEGDSLWRIAKEVYGEGQFYHVIETTNKKTLASLRPGQALRLAPFYRLASEDEVVVTAGDSLWRIAKDKLGDPLLYRQLLVLNRQRIADPRKLNALMPIQIKKRETR